MAHGSAVNGSQGHVAQQRSGGGSLHFSGGFDRNEGVAGMNYYGGGGQFGGGIRGSDYNEEAYGGSWPKA